MFERIVKVLLKGEPVHAYNISNPDSTISIKQMAKLLTKSAGVNLRLELPTEEEKKGFNPMSNSECEPCIVNKKLEDEGFADACVKWSYR